MLKDVTRGLITLTLPFVWSSAFAQARPSKRR